MADKCFHATLLRGTRYTHINGTVSTLFPHDDSTRDSLFRLWIRCWECDYFGASLTLIDQTVIVSILVSFINRMCSSFPVAYYKIFGELKPILLVFKKENGFKFKAAVNGQYFLLVNWCDPHRRKQVCRKQLLYSRILSNRKKGW